MNLKVKPFSNHGQGNFRSVCKFILRYMNVINIDLYVIKNDNIYCEQDKYEVLNGLIVIHFKDEMKIIII